MDVLDKWKLSLVIIFCHRCQVEMTTGYKYLGCFKHHHTFEILSREVYTDPLLTPQRCCTRCEKLARSYFMLRNGNICACFEDVLDMAKYETSDACYLMCKGDRSETCGGRYAVEIFRVQYCPRLQQPANGHVIQNLSTAWFQCLEGYRLEGPNVIFCDMSTKQWNGSNIPFCKETNMKHMSFTTLHLNVDESRHPRGEPKGYVITIFLVSGFIAVIMTGVFVTRRYHLWERFKADKREKQRPQITEENPESYSNKQPTDPVDERETSIELTGDETAVSYDNAIYSLVKR